MPAKAVRSAEEIYEVLKLLPIFHNDKTLKKKEHKDSDGSNVWTKAIQKLYPMKKHNLYIFVHRNDYNIKTDLRNHHFPKFIPVKTQDAQQECFRGKDDSGGSSDDQAGSCNDKSEELDLDDEFDPLHEMKFNVQFHSIIRRISIWYFYVMYWSEDQKRMYKNFVKIKDNSVCLVYVKDVLPKIRMKNYISGSNSLISLVCEVNNNPIFLANTITETLDNECVQLFMRHFLKTAQSLPTVINVGYQKCIINEVCNAVNMCLFDEYNQQCFLHLKDKTIEKPKVLLSINFLDVLISVNKFYHLHDKVESIHKNVSKFLIYLEMVSDLKEFDAVVSEFLLLTFTPRKNVTYVNTLKFLEMKISNNSVISDRYEQFERLRNDPSHEKYTCEMEFDKLPITDIVRYIDNLKPPPNLEVDTRHKPNPYYLPEFYDSMLKFVLSHFVTWTNLLIKHKNFSDRDLIINGAKANLNSISTAKNTSSKITSFLEWHIMECDKLVLRTRGSLNNKKGKKQKEDCQKEECEQLSYLNPEENWMGLNKCYKRKLEEEKCENVYVNFEENESLSVDKQTTSNNYDNSTHHEIEAVTDNTCEIGDRNRFDDPCEMEENEIYSLPSSVLHAAGKENDVKQLNPKNAVTITVDNPSALLDELKEVGNKDLLSSSSLCDDVKNNSDIIAGGFFNCETRNINESDGSLNCTEPIPMKNSSLLSMKNDASAGSQHSLQKHNNLHWSIKESHDFDMDKNDETRFNSILSLNEAILEDSSEKNTNTEQQNSIQTENVPLLLESLKRNQLKNKVNKQPKLKRKPVKLIKKKKYISPCPNMMLKHKQVILSNATDHLICNGNALEPKSIGGSFYTLDNTSKFDVFAEIFSFGYKNFTVFRSFCDNMCDQTCTSLCFMKIVKNYSEKNSAASFYANRASLLFTLAQRDLGKIVISDSIDVFFAKLMSNHTSHSKTIYCGQCNQNVIYRERIINANIDSNSLAFLETYVTQYFNEYVFYNTSLLEM